MKLIKIISAIGAVAMLFIISYAFISGDFSSEGSKLLSMPWGIVSMVDLYVGFMLFSAWIVYRENSLISTIIWVFFMLTLGFFTGSLYVFITAQKSQGNWQKFWLGKHSNS
jgi:hypothetical protein